MEDPQFMPDIPVPRVQALAASLDGASDVPGRYIRPEAEADPVAEEVDGVELPVIDLALAQVSREESAKLGRACEEWGFFQIINHGVPTELVEKVKKNIHEFFKLPMEEKEAFALIPDGGDYNGYGQVLIKSKEQKLDWGDMIALNTNPANSRKMKFWPTYPPSFRDDLDAYATEMRELTICVLRLMAENLGVEPETLTKNFKDMKQTMRANYYPPCPKADKVLGICPHADADALTILLQANEVDGLQIRKNGLWFPIKPLPGAFIVNIGDFLEIFSNGKYKSIEHRGIVNTEKERLSLAAFQGTDEDCIIGPLPQLLEGGAVQNYMAISYWDYMKGFLSRKMVGKRNVASVMLNNTE